jgi:pimeloyl-ACP methyl ester carboxylesterase
MALAKAANDQDALAKLGAVGAPPWSNPRHFGVVRRIIRQYEAKTTIAMPAAWRVAAPAYTTPKALADFEGGEDYSFLQFVGMKGNGMFSRFDLSKLSKNFTLPFFLVQGTEDLLTRPEVAKAYFDSVTAPQKEFVLVPQAGHDPNQPTMDAQYKLLQERVRPLIK